MWFMPYPGPHRNYDDYGGGSGDYDNRINLMFISVIS